MDKSLSVIKWIMGGIMAIGALLLILVAIAIGNDSISWLGLKQGALEATVNWLIVYTYIVLVLGIAAIIFSAVKNATVNPKGIKKSLIILVGFVALVVVAYLLAPGSELVNYTGELTPTKFELKLTDTVIYLTYLTLAGAVLAILFSFIYNKNLR